MTQEHEPSRIMTKLAVVRHGEYDDDGRLDSEGLLQIQTFGRKLYELSEPETGSAVLLASPTDRTIQTAEEIARILKIESPIEKNPILYSTGRSELELEEIYKLVQEAGTRARLVIVVTHLEYAMRLPSYVIEQVFREKEPDFPVEKGEGVLIDFKTPAVTFLNRCFLSK